jgi:hypothetical protein
LDTGIRPGIPHENMAPGSIEAGEKCGWKPGGDVPRERRKRALNRDGLSGDGETPAPCTRCSDPANRSLPRTRGVRGWEKHGGGNSSADRWRSRTLFGRHRVGYETRSASGAHRWCEPESCTGENRSWASTTQEELFPQGRPAARHRVDTRPAHGDYGRCVVLTNPDFGIRGVDEWRGGVETERRSQPPMMVLLSAVPPRSCDG